MSGRELIVLGSASQRPTRTRNHNGYVLRWGRESLLFDPGEGTQRQFTFAGLSSAKVGHILLTHLHGDHCLGLPGMLQRMGMDGTDRIVTVHFPESGTEHVERLVNAGIGGRVPFELHPVPDEGARFTVGELSVTALPLAHRVPTLGWRVETKERDHLLPDRLAARGVNGPDRGRLLEAGRVEVGGEMVDLEEVSERRPGHAAAVVMDTGVCDNAVRLSRDVDLLLCEATYTEADRELAEQYRHLTAAQAADIARQAGARRLVLTHLSARYPSGAEHLAEARAVFDDVVVADDLQLVPAP